MSIQTVKKSPTRKIAYTVMLAALAMALAPLSLPLGPAKVFPGQHLVNVLAAALIGPWWGLLAAFITSLLRNMLGIGTLFAFPGSMVGVVVAGLFFRLGRRSWSLWLGEIIGSGIIGASLAALLVAPSMNLNNNPSIWGMIVLFIPSVVIGASLGMLGISALRRSGWVSNRDNSLI